MNQPLPILLTEEAGSDVRRGNGCVAKEARRAEPFLRSTGPTTHTSQEEP